MKSKKSQMEIIGIVIVVMLLFLGMYFMSTLGSTKKSNAKTAYVQHEVSANTLNTLLSTKVVCTKDYSLTLNELLYDCAISNDIECNATKSIGFDSDMFIDSCDFSNKTIFYILNNTLNKWNVNYFLNITYGDYPYTNSEFGRIEFINPRTIIRNNRVFPGCVRQYTGKSKLFPISLYPNPGILWVELFICN